MIGQLALLVVGSAVPSLHDDGPQQRSDNSVLGGRGPEIMRSFLAKKVKAAASQPTPGSLEEFEKERERRREELMRGLGLDPLPPRTPLNARVTGVIKRDGYRIEKIVFESRPNFPVTAHLYVPEGSDEKKFPVIVNPHGHWRHKKAEPVVQKRAIAQALHGYLAMVVDSPGSSFEGDAPIERRWAGTHHDLRLILGSSNATAIYVWDLMRALDYLETRPDADMSRVGITGASGGGLATVYAFAADDRFGCAVPVVYATSMEVNPVNGCLCNHVPATLQVGDRSDVLAIRAPAPVLIIGAQEDREFPPEGTRRTGEKLKESWSLFGAEADARWKLFDGPHDYNRAMRELALGFFDEHLRGVGDGSPVKEPEFETEPKDSRELLCLPDPPSGLATMQDIAKAKLAGARPISFAQVAELNGGLPERTPLNTKIIERNGSKLYMTFESEPGLTIPGVLYLPEGEPKAAVVLVAEKGKVVAQQEFSVERLVAAGYACLLIDVRGFGELQGLDPRLMAYLGTADPFAMGWDAARAAEAALQFSPRVAVVGRGPCGAQIALFAGLMEPRIEFVAGLLSVRDYAECFEEEVPTYSIQPRAAYSAPLSHLRSLLGDKAVWSFRGEEEPDLLQVLEQRFGREPAKTIPR
ncbi:MAG: prolyl oligopeptidase family serine peptidase [Armatimonadetes bacterium]|nr:prolyl oligopeptidase family serine peptidase [Armatimonadota bacterium]